MALVAPNALNNGLLYSHMPRPDYITPVTKESILDRQHYGGSSGGYHHHGGHSHGKKGKRSIALSALTLLSFLFFLNILQNCLQEQMDMMNPDVVVMQASLKQAREAEKRKGEDVVFINTSLTKEARVTKNKKETTEEENDKFTKIPIKLKTYDRLYDYSHKYP